MTQINLTAIETEGEADGAAAVAESVREADSAEVATYEPGGWVDAARNAGAHTFADSLRGLDDEAARAAYYAAYDRAARTAQQALTQTPPRPVTVTLTLWRTEWPSLDWLGASKDRGGAVGYAIVAGEGDGRRILDSAKEQALLRPLDEVRGAWERSECCYARVLL